MCYIGFSGSCYAGEANKHYEERKYMLHVALCCVKQKNKNNLRVELI